MSELTNERKEENQLSAYILISDRTNKVLYFDTVDRTGRGTNRVTVPVSSVTKTAQLMRKVKGYMVLEPSNTFECVLIQRDS